MNGLIEDMTNSDGKITCKRCDSTFVVYFSDCSETGFCPSCGVVLTEDNAEYKDEK